jgi:hypothetical protein
MTAAGRAETASSQGVVALTANEIRHLFTQLVNHTQHGIRHVLQSSPGRPRHKPAHAMPTAVRRSDSPAHEPRLQY